MNPWHRSACYSPTPLSAREDKSPACGEHSAEPRAWVAEEGWALSLWGGWDTLSPPPILLTADLGPGDWRVSRSPKGLLQLGTRLDTFYWLLPGHHDPTCTETPLPDRTKLHPQLTNSHPRLGDSESGCQGNDTGSRQKRGLQWPSAVGHQTHGHLHTPLARDTEKASTGHPCDHPSGHRGNGAGRSQSQEMMQFFICLFF